MSSLVSIVMVVMLAVLLGMLWFVARSTTKTILHYVFIALIIQLLIWNGAVFAGNLVYNDPELFVFVDNFTYVGAVFVPVTFLVLGLSYQKNFKGLTSRYLLLLIIPVLTLTTIFTNDTHNFFYISYSHETGYIVGPLFYIHAVFSYICMILGMVLLFYAAVKASGALSAQALLILVGSIVPGLANIFYTLNIPGFYVYTTSVAFSLTVLLWLVSIFRYDFLTVVPIATQTVINRISDCFVVINRDLKLITYNEPFATCFVNKSSAKQNNTLNELLEGMSFTSDQVGEVCWNITNAFETRKIQMADLELPGEEPLFYTVEYTPICEKGKNPVVVVLFKDITQHVLDLQALRENQAILLERERLASLGQMIGGIAHNMKSPILSISGGIDEVQCLVSEYRESVGDPEVVPEDHQEIAKEMSVWLVKMRNQLTYMSDIISTVKGQAAQFSEQSYHLFTIGDVLKRTNILMQHSLIKSNCTLEQEIGVNLEQTLYGDINSLVQILDNVIDNSIGAYGSGGGVIYLNVEDIEEAVRFSVKDNGAGIDPEIERLLFKEMTTTKGKHGTGLGLYMSYSTIKGMFRGNMWFETKLGVGTTFFMQIPLARKKR